MVKVPCRVLPAPGRVGRRSIVALLVFSAATIALGATQAAFSSPVSLERDAILQIESIALPPVMFPGDVTNEQLTSEVFEELTLVLALKGYVLHRVDRVVPRPDQNPPPIGELNADALADLLPEGGSHYLLCWIDYTLGGRGGASNSSASVSLSAALIDRGARRVLWRNTGSQGRLLFPANAPILVWIAAQDANAPYVPSALRQVEFDRSLQESTELGQSLLDMVSPVVGAVRTMLSTFPEKPMR